MKITDEIFNKKIKPLFAKSTFCSIATINSDGFAHVSPIGSVILHDKSHGVFYEKFTKNIPQNIKTNQLATIMCVNDGKWFWLKSLLKGKFKSPPAIRLVVKFGELRKEQDKEGKIFKRKVNIFKATRGYKILWSEMSDIREFEIIDYKPVYISSMTSEQFL
ncbi:MAG: pyridoxamine 5'-phosphate oxidase family protein [Proteobacteria bacterium]|nr:pyridoxamine 5'-phosphate oxidase family protein [Pseudomonadota bacterium]